MRSYLWQIPLIGPRGGGGKEVLSNKSPTEILTATSPPILESIQNVCELKSKRELI